MTNWFENKTKAIAGVVALLSGTISTLLLLISSKSLVIAVASAIILIICSLIISSKAEKRTIPYQGVQNSNSITRTQKKLAKITILIILIGWIIFGYKNWIYCEKQKPKYIVSICNFSKNASTNSFKTDLFTFLKMKHLNSDTFFFEDNKIYIDPNDRASNSIKKYCAFKGFVVYGMIDKNNGLYNYFIKPINAYRDEFTRNLNGEEIIFRNPKDSIVLNNLSLQVDALGNFILGLLHYSNGKNNESITHFINVQNITKRDSSSIDYWSSILSGYNYVQVGNFENALNEFKYAKAIGEPELNASLGIDDILRILLKNPNDSRISYPQDKSNSDQHIFFGDNSSEALLNEFSPPFNLNIRMIKENKGGIKYGLIKYENNSNKFRILIQPTYDTIYFGTFQPNYNYILGVNKRLDNKFYYYNEYGSLIFESSSQHLGNLIFFDSLKAFKRKGAN